MAAMLIVDSVARIMKPYILPAFIVKSSHEVALSTTCSGHKIICQQKTLLQQQVNDDAFLGLTDDGDFAMIGVNIDEITTDTTLDNDNISIKDDNVGTVRPPSSQSLSGFGSDVSLNDALFGRLSTSATANDTTTKTFAQSITLLDDNPTPSLSDSAIDKTQSDSASIASNYVTDEENLSNIEDWLLSIIPKLNPNDVRAYAFGLDEIGFNPDCITQCELRYEDLNFMKVLHRRYLFNEVTGIEHPFEV